MALPISRYRPTARQTLRVTAEVVGRRPLRAIFGLLPLTEIHARFRDASSGREIELRTPPLAKIRPRQVLPTHLDFWVNPSDFNDHLLCEDSLLALYQNNASFGAPAVISLPPEIEENPDPRGGTILALAWLHPRVKTYLMAAQLGFFLWASRAHLLAFTFPHPLLTYLIPGLTALAVYYVVARFLNRTVIVINESEISVTHGPLPFLARNVTVPMNPIASVTFDQQRVDSEGNGRRRFGVTVSDSTGNVRKVVANLERESHARYLAQRITECRGLAVADASGVGKTRRAG